MKTMAPTTQTKNHKLDHNNRLQYYISFSLPKKKKILYFLSHPKKKKEDYISFS